MKKTILYLIIIVIIIYGCANPLPPPGGPEDKKPPEVIATDPANNTLNFNGKSVSFTFNKYMERNKVNENIFISPTKTATYTWSGKKLEIKFEEPLDTNTTFAITLGTDYTDIRNNKPAQAYSLIFSTGSLIDSARIVGMLFDPKPDGSSIFCYRIDNINPDTLNPKHTKAPYITQIGTSGAFEIPALKKGLYRLIAVRDQYKDNIYDEGTDGFGAAPKDVRVDTGKPPSVALRVGPQIDKTAPALFESEALTNRVVLLTFSKNIIGSSIKPEAFSLIDSATKNNIQILSAYHSLKNLTKIEVITAIPLDSNRKYRITALRDSGKTIADSSGNIVSDTLNSMVFTGISAPDTLKPMLIKSPVADSTSNVYPDSAMIFVLNTAINKTNFDKRIKLTRLTGNETVQFKLTWHEDNIFSVTPSNRLASDAWYELDFNMDTLRGTNGALIQKDTNVRLRFKTLDIRSYSAVSGIVKDSMNCPGPYIITLVSNDNKRFTASADKKGSWEIRDVPPGSYKIEAFCDSDNNGVYSYGNVFPFVHGERFTFNTQEITVKARWKVENVVVLFP